MEFSTVLKNLIQSQQIDSFCTPSKKELQREKNYLENRISLQVSDSFRFQARKPTLLFARNGSELDFQKL